MQIRTQEPLKNWTTLKIGGPAKTFYQPENEEELSALIEQLNQKNEPMVVLGNGSNMLFEDEGFEGSVIQIGAPFATVEKLDDQTVRVGAGMVNEDLANWLAKEGLGGFEFASGIPGTIGGAVMMNAGAYDREIKDVITSVRYLDESGTLQEKQADDLDLAYRHSWFTDHFGVIVSADFAFVPKDSDQIFEKIKELHDKRWSKQPMDKASAGSTFKRPVNGYASAMIHECGLQGTSVGDAMVSTKHAGFLINDGNATCKDFLGLVEHVKQVVKEKKGADLELEVRFIPRSGK